MFKSYSFTSVNAQTSCVAVDGGLVMNNPSAAIVTHVLHNKRDFPTVTGVEDLLVLSIGNGDTNHSLQRKVNRSGYCNSQYVVGIMCDGVSEIVDQILGNAFCWNHVDHLFNC
ncbi:putative phosphoribosylamine--glycine ligase [Helianthus debilis subsp. tardiflorus]